MLKFFKELFKEDTSCPDHRLEETVRFEVPKNLKLIRLRCKNCNESYDRVEYYPKADMED